jgi:hypothetical protein
MNQKRVQLEAEIRDSAASMEEKANMVHTLSKLAMFTNEAIDEWKGRAARHGCNVADGDPDCG